MAPPPPHLPASIFCYTERRKTKREEKEEAIVALSGDKGKEVGAKQKDSMHCKKRLLIFPFLAGMSLTKLSLGGNNDVIYKLFPARKSLVSDIPAWDGKTANLFLQCESVLLFQYEYCILVKNYEKMVKTGLTKYKKIVKYVGKLKHIGLRTFMYQITYTYQ